MHHMIVEETASLRQDHQKLIILHERLSLEFESFKKKACIRIFNRNTMTKAFFAWRSVSPSSMERQGPYQVIHKLSEDLRVVRSASILQQRKISQLTTKLDLEIFDAAIGTNVELSQRLASKAFLLGSISPAMSTRQSLSTPKGPHSQLKLFS